MQALLPAEQWKQKQCLLLLLRCVGTCVQSTCLWRRTLHACLDLSRMQPSGLARRLGVGVTVAQGIIERLEHEGYLRPRKKRYVLPNNSVLLV